VNWKTYLTIHAALVCLAFGLLTACGGSSHSNSGGSSTPTVGISTNTGYTGSAATGGSFGSFAVTVTSNGSPASNVSVTFTAPSTGASGTFADGGAPAATDTETTGTNGVATSTAFTANGTSGTYAVTASVSGAATPATFNLTNTAAATTIAATSGGGQTATVGVAFANTLVATVMQGSTPVNGATVTFTAPSTGASGTFAQNGTATDTETTGTNGIATSTAFTANSTTGAYSVTATTSGASTPATFGLTNTTAVATTSTYVFYVTGQELINDGPNYYAIAGALTLDAAGDVVTGEQDYNDAYGLTSPGEPTTPDTIAAAASALVVDPTTGIGTLTLTTNNAAVGVNNGIEVFAVQFVNANHALITQFDGTATSSGSLDLQTATSASGNFAFTASGVDSNYEPVGFGGVFSASSGSIGGTLDVNDAGSGMEYIATAFTASGTSADPFGRSVITGITNPGTSTPVTFVSYAVGPEVMRIIDVDTADSAMGSAYGQGATTFNNTSLGSSVFALSGNGWNFGLATVGQFATSGTTGDPGTFSGIGDDNELDNGEPVLTDFSTSGVYTLQEPPPNNAYNNGWGAIEFTQSSAFGNITYFGLYMTDPTLNLNDPNNPAGAVGGGLLLEWDSALSGETGVFIPQTDTTTPDFAGSYAAGFTDFNDINLTGDCVYGVCEFDMVGPFTMTAGLLNTTTAYDSDPFGTISGVESITDTYTSTPLLVSPGYYSMSDANSTPNPLGVSIDGIPGEFQADIFQASGTQLFWIETDTGGVFLGPIEQQGSLTGLPGLKKRQTQTQAPNPNQQAIKGLFGGSSR
jgi:hypothetical protein